MVVGQPHGTEILDSVTQRIEKHSGVGWGQSRREEVTVIVGHSVGGLVVVCFVVVLVVDLVVLVGSAVAKGVRMLC